MAPRLTEKKARRAIWSRAVAIGLPVGLAVGLVVAAATTFADWRVNPGGLFHDGEGTNWRTVVETGLSWFIPVAALVGALASGCAWGILKRRGKSGS